MLKDPRSAGPRPPFSFPGTPSEQQAAFLQPTPDYGEASYEGLRRLQGCAAIVAGGDGGIGRAVAVAFAREGADVVISYLRGPEEARESARLVTDAGRRVKLLCGDVREEGYRLELVAAAIAEFGKLDILVNDTLYQWACEPLETLNVTDVEQTFRTTAESVLFLAEAAAVQMKPGGSIINTTAMHSSHPTAHPRAYSTNETAIANVTVSLAQRVAANGVRVNAVAPGPVWAPRMLWSLPQKDWPDFGSGTFLGRPAQPAEVAPAYVFLASNAATFISGTVLSVDGGWIVPRR
jgi:hypothetical protein